MLDLHIRLRFDDLQSLQALHLHTEIESTADAQLRELSGFTEWQVARGTRALSFGWDWTYQADKALLHGEWASLRTNLIMVDEHGLDLGRECTQLCVAQLMDRAGWAQVLAQRLDLPLRQQAA